MVKSRGQLARGLLRWYDRYQRRLPWRGDGISAYHVWLSEMMLQQTQVATVLPYFKKFTRRWPSLASLARADLDDVLKLWAGLGYYARVRSLHRTAQIITRDHHGRFPQDEAALKKLPGIGDYSAAAISAFAFGRYAVVIDGNIKRVLARMFRLRFDDAAAMREAAERLTPKTRAGDYAQALMDLGATLCTPIRPDCARCVWRKHCGAYQNDQVEQFGRRLTKKEKPLRTGRALVITTKAGDLFLIRRLPSGLLGGMTAFPSYGWDGKEKTPPPQFATAKLKWRHHKKAVHHVFTHFALTLDVAHACASKKQAAALAKIEGGHWVARKDFSEENLPSLMRKVWRFYDSNYFANGKSRKRIS